MFLSRARRDTHRANQLFKRADRLAAIAKAAIIFAVLALLVILLTFLFGTAPLWVGIVALLFFMVALPAQMLAFFFEARAESYRDSGRESLQQAALRGEVSWAKVPRY